MEKQLELNAVPQARKRIVDGPVASGEPKADLTVDVEAFIGLTEWKVGEPPPCTGFWEMQIGEGERVGREWYDAIERRWYRVLTQSGASLISSDYLEATPGVMKSIRWRGLQAAWPGGYDYPVPGGQLKLPLAPSRKKIDGGAKTIKDLKAQRYGTAVSSFIQKLAAWAGCSDFQSKSTPTRKRIES